MELFIALVIGLVGGTFYGWFLRERHAEKVIQKHIKKLEKKIVEEQKDTIRITVERHKDILYVYNQENNEFMGQGANKEELEEVLRSRFPGKRFACDEETMVKAGLL